MNKMNINIYTGEFTKKKTKCLNFVQKQSFVLKIFQFDTNEYIFSLFQKTRTGWTILPPVSVTFISSFVIFIHTWEPLTTLKSWPSAHKNKPRYHIVRPPPACQSRSASSFRPRTVSAILQNASLWCSADAPARRLLVLSSGRSYRSDPGMISGKSSGCSGPPTHCFVSILASTQ